MLYMKFYSIQKSLIGKIALFIAFLIPLINILIVIIQAKCFIFFKNRMKKVKRNFIMVPNPFLNFQKDNQLCSQLGSHSSSLTLSIKRMIEYM